MRNDCEDLCSCSDNKDPFALLKVSFPLSWAQRDKISKTKAELVWERPTEQEKVFVFITFITSPFSSHQKVSLYSTLSELTQPRAWGALDWRWENSVGLSECLWAQRCHPWPLSLVECVHQGWRDTLSGESRLWRVNVCSGISTCCMQWLANCWFAGVIPFSNRRKEKKKNPTKTNISTVPDCKPFLILMTELRLFFPKQIWNVWKAQGVKANLPGCSRPCLIPTPSGPAAATANLSPVPCHTPSFPVWAASVHTAPSAWRFLLSKSCPFQTQMVWQTLFWVEPHTPLEIRDVLQLFAFIQPLALSVLRLAL